MSDIGSDDSSSDDSSSDSDGDLSAQYKRIDRFYDVDYAEWRIVETPAVIIREKDQYGHLGEIINSVLHNVEGLAVIGDSSESKRAFIPASTTHRATWWCSLELPITTLEFFPFVYHPEHAWLGRKFADRGHKFAALCRLVRTYVHCQGIAEAIGGGFGEMYHTGVKFDLRNRVILDPATFWNLERPSDKPSVKHIEEDLNDIHYQLCNTWLPGFIMEHKKWGFIPIVDVSSIQWANNMLDSVVLPQTTKDLIQGFVTAHGDKSAVARLDDVVPGKGVGLVMLFTGPPGVGKTVTAEAVAEIAHRPLYSISASELGSQPSELDKNLARILRQGTMWDAVLLLDEADVFLEQRTSFDVKRNSLVSIFLRQLEYYTGIIVLTSNRVETFDKALESRVHFNLRFTALDRNSRMRLWTYFLNDHHQQFSNSDKSLLADLNFNGRMIQHAISLGRSLAKARREDFVYFHIQQVLDFIDPARRIAKIPNLERVHPASPLDPAISTTATPTDRTFSTPGGANIANVSPGVEMHIHGKGLTNLPLELA